MPIPSGFKTKYTSHRLIHTKLITSGQTHPLQRRFWAIPLPMSLHDWILFFLFSNPVWELIASSLGMFSTLMALSRVFEMLCSRNMTHSITSSQRSHLTVARMDMKLAQKDPSTPFRIEMDTVWRRGFKKDHYCSFNSFWFNWKIKVRNWDFH